MQRAPREGAARVCIQFGYAYARLVCSCRTIRTAGLGEVHAKGLDVDAKHSFLHMQTFEQSHSLCERLKFLFFALPCGHLCLACTIIEHIL